MAKARRAAVSDIEITAPASPNRLMTTRHLAASDASGGRRRVAVNLAESPLA